MQTIKQYIQKKRKELNKKFQDYLDLNNFEEALKIQDQLKILDEIESDSVCLA